MEEWRFEPAHDFGLSAEQRRLSLRREVGLENAISCFLWRSITQVYLATAHRLKIRGREILPLRFVGSVFPIAAGDTFFTKRASSIFATAFMNALPIWRKSCGAHSLEDLRERLLKASSVYILFPEGTRTRTGAMASFKPGLGRLVAGTSVPIVPCYLSGTFAALPTSATVPRWKRICVTIGKPLSFSATTNDRTGWESIAAATENAARALAN